MMLPKWRGFASRTTNLLPACKCPVSHEIFQGAPRYANQPGRFSGLAHDAGTVTRKPAKLMG
jgi:hypothetical protein